MCCLRVHLTDNNFILTSLSSLICEWNMGLHVYLKLTVIHSFALVWQQNSSIAQGCSPASSVFLPQSLGCPIKEGSCEKGGRRSVVLWALDCHVMPLLGGGTCGLCCGSLQANKTRTCSLAANELPRQWRHCSPLPLFCIFGLQDARRSQTSLISPISELIVFITRQRTWENGNGAFCGRGRINTRQMWDSIVSHICLLFVSPSLLVMRKSAQDIRLLGYYLKNTLQGQP